MRAQIFCNCSAPELSLRYSVAHTTQIYQSPPSATSALRPSRRRMQLNKVLSCCWVKIQCVKIRVHAIIAKGTARAQCPWTQFSIFNPEKSLKSDSLLVTNTTSKDIACAAINLSNASLLRARFAARNGPYARSHCLKRRHPNLFQQTIQQRLILCCCLTGTGHTKLQLGKRDRRNHHIPTKHSAKRACT